MPRLHLLIPLICAALLSAGCSTVRFSYGQAERVAAWYAESYVTLDSRQSRLLGQHLVDFKQWHCSTQVGGYAAWLRQVGDEFQPGVDAERVAARLGNLQHFAKVMAEHAAPRLAVLSRSMNEAQIAELKESFDKSNRKYREKWVDAPEHRIRAERAKRLKSRIEWWTGSLDRHQRTLVEAWGRDLQLTGHDTLASRTRWQLELLRVLGARGEDHRLEAEFRTVLAEPDRFWTRRLVEQVEANRVLTIDLLVGIANTMDDAQRKHVRARATAMAADFDALVCPPGRVVADAG